MRHLCPSIAFALVAAGAARADVTVFDDEADFLAAAPIVATETFDDLPDMEVPRTLAVDSLGFITRDLWVVPGGCQVNRDLGANNIARRHIVFQAPGGGRGVVTAVGLRLLTIAVSPPADYGIAVLTVDGAATQVPVDDVTNSNPGYRGFISTTPIEAIAVRAVGGAHINFCFDDVSHSAITPAAEQGGDPDVIDPRAYD